MNDYIDPIFAKVVCKEVDRRHKERIKQENDMKKFGKKSMKLDGKMAAAGDEQPFNPALKGDIKKVMKNLKNMKKKKLKDVVETDDRRTVQVKYEFTGDEIKKIAQDLAQRQIELVEVEDEKKSVMASFTDRVKAKKIDIGKFSRQVRDGYELRDHSCTITFDFKKKEKRYKDIDTKKVVKTESFTPGDEQRRFV